MNLKALWLAALLLPLGVRAIEPDMLEEQHRLLRIQSDYPGFSRKTVHAVTGVLPQIPVTVRQEAFPRTWQVVSFWGDCCAAGEIPAGITAFAIPQLPRGYYTLTVKRGDKRYHRTVFAVMGEIPAAPKLESPYGINMHFSHSLVHPEFSAVIRATGIPQLRESCAWNIAEAKKGVLSMNHPVAQCVDKGTKGFKTTFVCSYGNRHYDQYSSPHTKEGVAAWQRYVAWLPKNYPQCSELEIWNEFNCSFLLRGVVEPTPENYLKLSKATYEAAKKSAPHVPVVGCSTSLLPWGWLEKYFQLGGLNYLDVVSCHPYRWGKWETPPETLVADMIRLRKLIDRYAKGRHIPIYANEFGWPCGAEWEVTPEMQAVYLPRAYAALAEAGVARGYWYKMILHPKEREQWQMVKQTNFNCYLPDPACASFAAMARELLDARFVKVIKNIEPARALEFEQQGKKVWQLWGTAEPASVEIAAAGPVEVKDLFGAAKILTPVEGKITLFLCNATVYLRGNVKSFALSKSTTCRMVEKPVVGNPLRLAFQAPGKSELVLRGRTFQPGEIQLPGDGKIGGCALAGELFRQGKRCGLLYYEYEAEPQLKLRGMRLNAQGDLVVHFANALPGKAQRLTRFTASVDGKPGDVHVVRTDGRKVDLALNVTLPAQPEAELVIPKVIPNAKPFELNVLKANFHFDRHAVVSGQESVTYAPCRYRRRFKSIFDPKDWENVPAIEVEEFGTQSRVFFGHHVSPTLSSTKGKLWIAWNENELLVTACFDDASHCMKFPAWMGDGLQFAFGPLKAGIETSQELTACYRDQKDQSILYTSLMPAGFDGSAVQRQARCHFSRQGNKTIYLIAIPWETLPFLKPQPGQPFRFSLVVNSCDNNGPRAGLCWGDGILATKGSKLYPVCIFEK